MRHGVRFGLVGLLAVLSFGSTARAEDKAEAEAAPNATAPNATAPNATAPNATAWPAPNATALPAPTADDLSQRSARMAAALERVAQANRSSATRTAFQLTWGSLFVGLAGYFAFSKNVEQGTGSSRGAAVLLSMMTGATSLGRGVYGLTGVRSSEQNRLERFKLRQQSGPLSEPELGRFEAQLELLADQARSARYWESAASLGMAVGGATLLTFGATSELRKSAREIVYIEGGVMLLSGLGVGLYSLLSESTSETEWRNYRAGTTAPLAKPAARAGVRWQLTPVVSANVAALSVQGQF